MKYILKQLIIVFIFLIGSLQLFAQDIPTTKVSGMVLDTMFRPIEYAAVQFFSKTNENKSYGTITQKDGTYSIKNVEIDKYLIKVSSVGYQSETASIDIITAKKNTPVRLIRLKEDIIEMDEVKIVATRNGVTEKVDKTIFIPDSITLRSAKTGIDVIRKLPEVKIDKKDRSISILGNKNILVLINGIDNNRSIESIHPDDIERIEIITHPSVKYRSDIASVINIVLKGYKEKGLTVSSNMYYCIDKKNHSGNIMLDYQSGKWRFFASYFGNFSLAESIDSTHRIDIYENETTEYKSLPLSNNRSDVGYNKIQYGFDYNINKNNILSFTSRVTSFKLESFRNKNVLSLTNDIPYKQSKIESLYNSDRVEQNYSLYYLHKFSKEDESLSINTNFYILNKSSDYIINDSSLYLPSLNSTYLTRNTNSLSSQNSINTKIDYNYPINDKTKLETGYQLYYRDVNSDIWATDNEESDVVYKDLRNSLYANITFALDKLSFQTGVRIENSHIAPNEEEYNQTHFLPYGAILYKPKPNHSLKLTYRKILNYPNYSYLNPFKYYSSDSLSYSTGNPSLKPEQKNNFNLKYVFRKNDTYLSPSIYYNFLDDLIEQQTKINEDVLIYRFENLGKAKQYGFGLSFSTVLFDWAEIETQFRGYYTDFKEHNGHNGFSYAAEYGAVLPLPLGFDLEIYGLIAEKEIDYNGYSKYDGYIDEILITKDITKNLFVGFSIWQPFSKVTDTYKQWGDTFTEINKYTEVNSTSYLLNITYYFKTGKKINKINKESFMESNQQNKKNRRK
jgi:hypothetical protein